MPASAPKVAPWEDFVLRAIAVWKLSHAIFFTAVGFGLLRLRGHNVVDFLNAHIILPYHLNPESQAIDWLLDQAGALTSHKLLLLGYAAFFYAALFAAEGIGLFLRKHWAEYLVVVVTASLLPIEFHELFRRFADWKLAAVIGNLLILAYLIHRIRLDHRAKARLRESASDVAAKASAGSRPVEDSAASCPKPVANEVP